MVKTWTPYQLLFPLGILLGIVGVSFWSLYAIGWIDTVPSSYHIDLQIQGFLLSFVLGFLMTALPRFSKTWPAKRWELTVAISFLIIGNLLTVLGQNPLYGITQDRKVPCSSGNVFVNPKGHMTHDTEES